MHHVHLVIVVGSPHVICHVSPQILGSNNGTKHGFQLMNWALNPIRK